MLVVGVLLLAGLIFAGGTIAVFMSPKDAVPTNQIVAFVPDATGLAIFEQVTPTPESTATPWFPSASPSFGLPSPTFSFEVTLPPPTIPVVVTPRPTRNPAPTPTKTPVPTPTAIHQPVAKFGWNQQGAQFNVKFTDKSTGDITGWSWTFGEGQGGSTEQSPSHEYPGYGEWNVTLTVTGPGGSHSRSHTVTFVAPTEPPTPTPTPTLETPTPCPHPPGCP